MNTFTLNGNVVVAKKFDFNLVCDLEDMGVSLQESGKKPMAMIRAYIALCLGSTVELAGKELEEHLANGGSFEDLYETMSKEMENSDFFATSISQRQLRRKLQRHRQAKNRSIQKHKRVH